MPQHELLQTAVFWAGFVVLVFLCLPFARLSKVIVTLMSYALRIGLLALLAVAVWLWLTPDQLPAQAAAWYEANTPAQWQAELPAPGTALFVPFWAGIAVLVLVPFLAVFDVARRAALVQHADPRAPVGPLAGANEETSTEKSPSRKRPIRGGNAQRAAEKMAHAQESAKAPRLSDFVE